MEQTFRRDKRSVKIIRGLKVGPDRRLPSRRDGLLLFDRYDSPSAILSEGRHQTRRLWLVANLLPTLRLSLIPDGTPPPGSAACRRWS